MAITYASASSQYCSGDGAIAAYTFMDGSSAIWTVSMWFKTTQAGSILNQGSGVPAGPMLFERRQQSTLSRDISIGVHTGNVFAAAVCTGTDFTNICAGTTDVHTGAWFHGVAWRNGTTSMKVFVNGIQEGSTSTSVAGITGYHLTMGCRTLNNGARGAFFNGTMEDVRLYNRVLSDNEIQTLYGSCGWDGISHGLVGRWFGREKHPASTATVAGSVIDLSDTKQNMTPTASPTYSDGVVMARRRRNA